MCPTTKFTKSESRKASTDESKLLVIKSKYWPSANAKRLMGSDSCGYVYKRRIRYNIFLDIHSTYICMYFYDVYKACSARPVLSPRITCSSLAYSYIIADNKSECWQLHKMVVWWSCDWQLRARRWKVGPWENVTSCLNCSELTFIFLEFFRCFLL